MLTNFLGEGWGLVGAAGALAFDDPQFPLDETEADELSQRTIDTLAALDAKKLKQLEKKIGPWLPALLLLMSVLAIFGPRVSRQFKKLMPTPVRPLPPEMTPHGQPVSTSPETSRDTTAGAGDAHASPTVANPVVAMAGEHGAEPTQGSLHFRPFRREDVLAFDRFDDAGAM